MLIKKGKKWLMMGIGLRWVGGWLLLVSGLLAIGGRPAMIHLGLGPTGLELASNATFGIMLFGAVSLALGVWWQHRPAR